MQNLIFSIFPNQNFVDLGLFQFGWERCTPAHSFGPAARNHYLFHYILSGTGTLMADDSKGVTQTYSIKSMQGFMIFPNQITTYVADKQLPWEYVWLEFDGLRVKSLLDTMEAGKSVVITEGVKTNVVLSARNLPGVKTTAVRQEAPASIQCKGTTLTYTYRFDKAVQDVHQAGTYTFTVDLTTGNVSSTVPN